MSGALVSYIARRWRHGRTALTLHDVVRGETYWGRIGFWTFPGGHVAVEIWRWVGGNQLHLRLNRDGIQYNRWWRQSFRDRTIARLCREFVEDVEAGRFEVTG